MQQKKEQSWLERHITLHTYDDPKAEKENAITHLVGTVMAIAAFVIILFRIPSLPTFSLKLGMIIWGLTMILLYAASTLYHSLPYGDGKRLCRILDHSNIYFLIAGTYTPLLMYAGTSKTYAILALVWGVAVVGILFTLLIWGKMGALHVALYIGMGWLVVIFWNDVVPYLPAGITTWILAAGLTYTIGVFFYANKRIPHYHAIWHLFCIGGSAIFFIGYMIKLL